MPDDALGSSGHAGGGAAGGIIATILAAGAAAYFHLRPIGSLSVIACSVISLLCLMTVRYYRIALQDAKLRRGSRSRVPYDMLRAQLEDGDGTETLYQRWLYTALERVDRFFGDGETESASLSLWPRAFGLNTSAPLWTARAFDRCLLLAFVYPIALVFVLWALTGQQGPAEAALGMSATLTPWKRLGNLFGASSGIFLLAVAARSKVWWHPLAAYFAVTAFVAVGGAGDVAVAVGLVGAGAVGVAGAVAGANAVAVAVAIAFAVDSVGAVDAGAAGAVGIGVGAAINALHKPARNRRREGYFQAVLLLLLLAVCVLAPRWLATQQNWMFFGPVLLWLGLLPLVNAPFDWFSLGLTRALLRRGLEKKSWWPYAFAAIDATAAVAVVAALAIAMLLSVQLFDDVAAHAGGRATLDLTALLDGMRMHPERPEFYWLYFTLFSTMIPSVVNLCIGGFSLLRGAPPLRRLLLRHMPRTGAVARADLVWMPLMLMTQLFGGVVLALLVQALLFFGIVGHLLPLVGFDLLEMCSELATADLPGQALRLVGW